MYLHDLIIADFERTKSFSGLKYLLSNGRELEFSLYGKKYFISCDKSSKYVSIWDDHNEQSFDSIEELVENAVVSDSTLISIWPEIQIETIF